MQIKIEFQKRKNKTQKALKELQPNTQVRNMIEFLQEYIFLRTYRTDALRKVTYYIQPLVEEIDRRLRIKKEEAAYLTRKEIKNWLLRAKSVDVKILRERIKHYLMLMTQKTCKIISDKKEIEEFIKQELKEEIKIKVLKGNTAYPGIVKGKIKIIRIIKDIGKLEKGEILVTSMTTPDMTIAVRKTAAIVTDEGGITCHAAIISRELNIPCIIGTKIATKVLKDGDLVEVDAGKGIVKILKKK